MHKNYLTLFVIIAVFFGGLVSQNISNNAKATENGTGWSDIEIVSAGVLGDAKQPSLFIDNDETYHLVWVDKINYEVSGSDYDIYYREKQKGGNWSDIELVSTESTGNSYDAKVVVDSSGVIHIAWRDETPCNISNAYRNIFYKEKLTNGSWTDTKVISENATDVSTFSIYVDHNKTVHIAWSDKYNYEESRDDYDIFYRIKYSNGSWSPIEVISKESHLDCKWPWMTVDQNDTIYVAWCDKVSGLDYDVVLTYRENGRWIHPELVSKDSSYDSNWPRMVIDSNQTIHMTWWDDVGGHWKIFYSYGYKKNLIEKDTPIYSLIYLISILFILSFFRKILKNC